jgi:hypothetical protein
LIWDQKSRFANYYENSNNHNLIQESSPREAGDIREAMQKVLAKILPHGILLALGHHVLRAGELGFFENEYCFRCQQHVQNFPETLFDIQCYDILSEILPICTGQSFFETLCTRIVECTLLGMVWAIVDERCVFVFNL